MEEGEEGEREGGREGGRGGREGGREGGEEGRGEGGRNVMAVGQEQLIITHLECNLTFNGSVAV